MIVEKAHEISRPGELDTIAQRLFSKPYIKLTDTEASAVWNDIEKEESA